MESAPIGAPLGGAVGLLFVMADGTTGTMVALRLPAWAKAGDESLVSATIAGRRVRYVVRGAGEPVVLVHA